MDYAHIAILTPYPGTEIYQEALETGVYDHDFWRQFALRPTPDFEPRFWTQEYSAEQLQELLRKAYLRFYRRPRYLFQRLLRVRSLGELFNKGKLGLNLLYTMSFGR